MDGGVEMDSAGSGYGPVVGYFKHGNEPSCSIKKVGFFKKLSKYKVFNKYSAPCKK
jgi:hypothetical protein